MKTAIGSTLSRSCGLRYRLAWSDEPTYERTKPVPIPRKQIPRLSVAEDVPDTVVEAKGEALRFLRWIVVRLALACHAVQRGSDRCGRVRRIVLRWTYAFVALASSVGLERSLGERKRRCFAIYFDTLDQ